MEQQQQLRRRKGELSLQAARYGISTPPEISIELQDIDIILSQIELIVIHRRNLQTLTKQASHFGANVPPHILSQIASERAEIARIKRVCATKRHPVADDPIDSDDDPAVETPAHVPTTPLPISQLDRIERKLDRLLALLGESKA